MYSLSSQLEKRADAADTVVFFFFFAVLIFGLWAFLLDLCKILSKKVLMSMIVLKQLADTKIDNQ